MARFFARVTLSVRGGDGTAPPVPADPFHLDAFDNTPAAGLPGVPLVVQAEYSASQDVAGADALVALGKVNTFLSNRVPALVPVGARVIEMRVSLEEWPA